jgi:hypothetical protein
VVVDAGGNAAISNKEIKGFVQTIGIVVVVVVKLIAINSQITLSIFCKTTVIVSFVLTPEQGRFGPV